MPRKQKRGKQRWNSTDKAQTQVSLYEAAIGREVPDHELNVVGLANPVRRFDIDEALNGPSVVYRMCKPYDSFIRGYSYTSWDDGSVGDLLDTTIADPATALVPVCPIPLYFEEDVWPVLDNVFASGTGVRPTITINEFVKYQGLVLYCYTQLLAPVIVNWLAFKMDWRTVYPFTENTPSHIYQLVENLNATDIGLAETWLPLMRRMDNKIVFPRMVEEVKRMLTPMMSVDFHGRLQIPMAVNPATIDAATIVADVVDKLDYIRSHLGDTANLLNSFLPFPFKEMNPWLLPSGAAIDVDRDSGWYNSGTGDVTVFNDTGDPTNLIELILDEAEDYKGVWFTRHCQPIWAELKLATMFEVTDELVDDKFRIITPHNYQNIHILDDAFDVFSFNGTQIDTGEAGFRYIDYANSRYASVDVPWGIQKPGTMGAYIYYDTINRLVRLETNYIFNAEILKTVATQMAGASLRELRHTIRTLIYEGVKSPI